MPRKVRSDAVLANLSPELQEQVIAWCDTPRRGSVEGGLRYAMQQLAERGIATSQGPLSTFYRTWQLRHDLDLAERVAEAVREAGTSRAKAARKAAETMLLELSMARQDEKLFAAAVRSMDSRRQIELREDAVRLAEKKFQRDTCEICLHWQEDDLARQIAAGSGSHAEKIEALGQHLFGEAWDG